MVKIEIYCLLYHDCKISSRDLSECKVCFVVLFHFWQNGGQSNSLVIILKKNAI